LQIFTTSFQNFIFANWWINYCFSGFYSILYPNKGITNNGNLYFMHLLTGFHRTCCVSMLCIRLKDVFIAYLDNICLLSIFLEDLKSLTYIGNDFYCCRSDGTNKIVHYLFFFSIYFSFLSIFLFCIPTRASFLAEQPLEGVPSVS